MWKIYKDDNEDLDFVLSCLFYQAISLDEVKIWAEEVIRTTSFEMIPNYIFDLVSCNYSINELDDIIGFNTDGQSTKDRYAIYGVAFLRNIDVYDPPVSKEKALAALKKNPQVMKEFKRFFPFVKFESE